MSDWIDRFANATVPIGYDVMTRRDPSNRSVIVWVSKTIWPFVCEEKAVFEYRQIAYCEFGPQEVRDIVARRLESIIAKIDSQFAAMQANTSEEIRHYSEEHR